MMSSLLCHIQPAGEEIKFCLYTKLVGSIP